MPVNIEIKSRVRDATAFKARAGGLSDSPMETIPQEDTFFHVSQGRLKMRILAPDCGELIYYTRPDDPGPKRSKYQIYRTNRPEELKVLLSQSLGVRGVVRKIRFLFCVGQTRIHLDEVENLGTFAELEVVLQPSQSEAEGLKIAENLAVELGIREEDLVKGGYIDLMEG